MIISERFEQFLGIKRISQRDFSEIPGFPAYSLSKIITGRTQIPKIDLIIALMQYFPELNLRWLLIGEGEMFQAPIEETNSELVIRNEKLQIENSKLRNDLILAKDKIIELLEK
jgi:transcriptional regulator with XRE-family HTH domain